MKLQHFYSLRPSFSSLLLESTIPNRRTKKIKKGRENDAIFSKRFCCRFNRLVLQINSIFSETLMPQRPLNSKQSPFLIRRRDDETGQAEWKFQPYSSEPPNDLVSICAISHHHRYLYHNVYPKLWYLFNVHVTYLRLNARPTRTQIPSNREKIFEGETTFRVMHKSDTCV